MLKSLKVEAESLPEKHDDLYTWNVKRLRVNKRNRVYLMSNASKISLIFYGMTQKEFKDFHNIVIDAIKQVLWDGQLEGWLVEASLKDVNKIIYTTIGTKRQIGSFE